MYDFLKVEEELRLQLPSELEPEPEEEANALPAED